MDYTLPSYMVIKKGDFKGVFDGYFLVTDTYATKPVVGSQILSRLNYLVNTVNVFHTDKTFENAVSDELKAYGIDPGQFILYLFYNKKKILDAVGDYEVLKTLIADYEKLAQIKQGHSVGEFIDFVAGKAKDAVSSVASGIGDVLSNLLKHLLPALIILVIVFIIIVYGIKTVNNSKH
jgi:hypothetical protein